jgi:hypothetical protein
MPGEVDSFQQHARGKMRHLLNLSCGVSKDCRAAAAQQTIAAAAAGIWRLSVSLCSPSLHRNHQLQEHKLVRTAATAAHGHNTSSAAANGDLAVDSQPPPLHHNHQLQEHKSGMLLKPVTARAPTCTTLASPWERCQHQRQCCCLLQSPLGVAVQWWEQ